MSKWSGVAEAYRTSFATLCAGTVERLLADTIGDDHLDVGCGTGDLALAATRLGRQVVAVDADPEMVAMTTAAMRGVVIEAALPHLPFDDASFDVVTANFVVNHVPDPRAAVRELARVARPGGRVAVTCWPARTQPWASLVGDAFTAAGVVPQTGQRLSPELDFERSVTGLRGLAEDAGLKVVTATELRWEWEIGVDALWSGITGGVATVGQTFLAQTGEVQDKAETELRQIMGEVARDGMLGLPSAAAYVVAVA
ncbi:class I SAM-dependent methyltransferase [Nocardioides halotolerans]|uniref:class I SAM-dependent methyltransferase n=1 Tax=Nocardioides halotolerans TaxID=433660 RepID=UPI000412AD7F|nr:class I SAM-dependent methyltransferase [Nocardioides halotolerans]